MGRDDARLATRGNIETIAEMQRLDDRPVADFPFAVHALCSKRNAAIRLIAAIR